MGDSVLAKRERCLSPQPVRSAAMWSLAPVRPGHLLSHTTRVLSRSPQPTKASVSPYPGRGRVSLRFLPVLSLPFLLPSPAKQKTKPKREINKQKTQALSHLKTNTSLKQLSRAQKRCETTCATRAALRPPVAAYGTKTRPPHRPARKRLEALCSPAPREVSVRGGGQLPLTTEKRLNLERTKTLNL